MLNKKNCGESERNISFKPATTLFEAFIVRCLRNECRTYLTNYQKKIGIFQQIYWYLSYYRKAVRAGIYRVFLARNDQGQPVGYGALNLTNGQLRVTECVARKYRGRGWGTAILENLITIAKREQYPLIAEIWATNKISIALHRKCGFKLEKTKVKSGHKLYIYRKEIGKD